MKQLENFDKTLAIHLCFPVSNFYAMWYAPVSVKLQKFNGFLEIGFVSGQITIYVRIQ